MIIVNGHKFAESNMEFTESLFSGKTCYGYAKRKKRRIDFLDMQGNILGMFNCHGVFATGVKLDNGKIWWTYRNPIFMDEYNYDSKTWKDYRKLVETFAQAYAKGRDRSGFFFK